MQTPGKKSIREIHEIKHIEHLWIHRRYTTGDLNLFKKDKFEITEREKRNIGVNEGGSL